MTAVFTGTSELEAELERVMAARTAQAAAYGERFAEHWSIASACVRGGKLLRPRMLVDAFDALTSDDGSRVARDGVVRLAVGVELLHYSFLLHDDVIDGDLVRRGRPNLIGTILGRHDPEDPAQTGVAASAAARHWAQTSGILMGDMLLAAAHQIFATEAMPDDVRLRLLALLDRTVTETMLGEHLDAALGDLVLDGDLATVLQMTRLKTATYTFELPLRAAAILAGTTRSAEDEIGCVGRHLGIAYQLQDDLLSTFGDPEEHGKDAYSDLRTGKQTAIIAYARTTDAWDRIRPGFGDPGLALADADAVRGMLVDCGAEAFAESLVRDQVHAVRLTLSTATGIAPALAAYVDDLVAELEGRRS